uniref:Uncharacterized protein n=1 Tax=Arundo donax TaxID=35708 RepID=A0A0A8YZB7_ARUDO
MMGQPGHLVSTFHGYVSTKFGIHQLVKSLFLSEMRASPFHQVMLPNWTVLVHRSPACHQLQKHHPEAIDIAFGCQMACHDILWRSIPICTHDSGRYMGLITLWTIPSKPEI